MYFKSNAITNWPHHLIAILLLTTILNIYLIVEVVFVDVVFVDVESEERSHSINVDRFQFPGFVPSFFVVRQGYVAAIHTEKLTQ